MEICGPKGRDCIERNSTKSFNCSTTCEGIYADVQWVGKKIEEMEDDEEAVERKLEGEVGEELAKVYKQLAELKTEMKLMKRGGQELGEEVEAQVVEDFLAS